ncbi:carbohydrate kinase [Canariomyces notabilis]|uniref:gluconokinase n=1 Tax=Canariomyces notabilis TaxID=2074819 RepID=A0AAN6TDZ0_9PEZI|nr:carbohydrate kinase [Canariomyces arenarius]
MAQADVQQPPDYNLNGNLNRRWVWFITGPTASGKTTIAKALAQSLGFIFVEGDDYHPPQNRDKMSHNIPLTDADRTAWLRAIHDRETSNSASSPPPSSPAQQQRQQQQHPDDPNSNNLIITCSALKRKYRDVLRGRHRDQPQLDDDHDADTPPAAARTPSQSQTLPHIRFVLLDVDASLLRERAAQRKGHFAGPGLVQSQLQDLERPEGDSERDVVVVRVEKDQSVEETVKQVERRVREEMGRERMEMNGNGNGEGFLKVL